MSLTKECRAVGIDNVSELAELSNMPYRTLYKKYRNNPQLCNAIIVGCAAIKVGKKRKQNITK